MEVMQLLPSMPVNVRLVFFVFSSSSRRRLTLLGVRSPPFPILFALRPHFIAAAAAGLCDTQMIVSSQNSTWHGGSMLASMQGGERFFVTPKEFEELGFEICAEKFVVRLSFALA